MCDGDIDTILSYLSSKINKIVCDRDFVGCVKEDLDLILENSNNYCVVFPKLKPVFLKLLRYQALIFDLNVFQIGSGQNQISVVCKKAILKDQTECLTKNSPKTMSEKESLVKVKKNRANRPTQSYYIPPAQRSKKKGEVKTTKKKHDLETIISQRANLSVSESSDDKETLQSEEEKVCCKDEEELDCLIKSDVEDVFETFLVNISSDCDSSTASGLTIKDEATEDSVVTIACNPNVRLEDEAIEDSVVTIACNPSVRLEESVIDLPLELIKEGDCVNEPASVCTCEPSLIVIDEPSSTNNKDSTSVNEEDSSTIKNNINKLEIRENTKESDLFISTSTINQKSADNEAEIEKEMQKAIQNINRKRRTIIKHIRNDNTSNEIIELPKTCEEDLNDESDLSNWEDMFDDSGDLKSKYFKEIVKHIGCDVKVVKASHDYTAYENTKYQDLEHVIELYDFPSTFRTQDLVQLYSSASKDPMYIKWCDNTHALLVLSTPSKAQRALKIEHDIIKSRPLSEGSSVAIAIACSTDLKPAMTRPATNMQTARRLINTHLGTRSALSKEVQEQERQALKVAREQRRQERQNEKDAWEGRLRSAKSQCSS